MSGKSREGIILSLVNNKGGVGKTTTAVNLAACLAERDLRILLVDLDAQGSASFSLGLTRSDIFPGTAEVILDEMDPLEAIRKTYIEGLDIMPGSVNLASADVNLANTDDREITLRKALERVLSGYDYIIVDCPPSLGLLSVNAITASDYLLVTVTPEYLGFEGLINLMEAVQLVREGIGQAGSMLGIILTMVDGRQRTTRIIKKEIRRQFEDMVFKNEIKMNVRLKEAPSLGKAIKDFDRNCTGSRNYNNLAKEILYRIRERRN